MFTKEKRSRIIKSNLTTLTEKSISEKLKDFSDKSLTSATPLVLGKIREDLGLEDIRMWEFSTRSKLDIPYIEQARVIGLIYDQLRCRIRSHQGKVHFISSVFRITPASANLLIVSKASRIALVIYRHFIAKEKGYGIADVRKDISSISGIDIQHNMDIDAFLERFVRITLVKKIGVTPTQLTKVFGKNIKTLM